MHARKVAGVVASVALAALFVLGGANRYREHRRALRSAHTDSLVASSVVVVHTPTADEVIRQQIDFLIPNSKEQGVEWVLDGDEVCGASAAACVVHNLPTYIRFDSDAFAYWGTPSADAPQDRYLILHEAAHVAQYLRWGSFEAAEVALDAHSQTPRLKSAHSSPPIRSAQKRS